MQLNDLFPMQDLPPRARKAILSEFHGRHPTIGEVVLVPDSYWLGVPAIGPATLAKLRALTRGVGARIRAPSLAETTDRELLAQRATLRSKLKQIRGELRANSAELRLRGLPAAPERR